MVSSTLNATNPSAADKAVAVKTTAVTTTKKIPPVSAQKAVDSPHVLALEMYSKRAIILLDLAMERGAERRAIVARTPAQSVALGDIPLFTIQDQIMLMTNVMSVFPESDIALCWGSRMGLSARGGISLALMNLPLFKDVVEVTERLQEVLQLPYRAWHEVRGDEVWFMLDYPSALRHLPLVRFNVESIFASHVATISSLLARHALATRVMMLGKRPVYEESYRKYISRHTEFDAADFALVYPASVLQEPVAGSNPVLASHYLQDFNEALRETRAHRALGPAVSAILASRIGGYPDLPVLAKSLGLGERSLRRRLADENVSYQALLNEVKQRHAQELLDNASMSVESVAMQLGFSDTANFRRAFRKWTGLTPAEWRRRDRG